MLTREQLEKLRSEICLGSLYNCDYENSLGIDCNRVYDFCEGYLDYLKEIKGTDDLNTLYSTDSTDIMYNWYRMFEEDPLPIEKVWDLKY